MICANCDSVFESKFCPNCGQKADIHQISIKTVAHDLLHAFTHTDKGFLLTIKELIKRPGIVAKEYINGKRKKYFNPLSFLVITMAVSAYLSFKSGYFESFAPKKTKTTTEQQDTKKPVEQKQLDTFARVRMEAYRIIIHDGKMLGLVLITPLITILSWIFFRKPKHGIAEHFVLQSYLFGLSNIFRVVLFIPLFIITGLNVKIIDYVFQILFLFYLILGFHQFFRNRIFFTIIKSILILVLFIFLFWYSIWGYVYAKHFIIDLLN